MNYDQIAVLVREERLAATARLWRAHPLRFVPPPESDLVEMHGLYLTKAQQRTLTELANDAS